MNECMCVCTYVCMYVCMYVRTYVCMCAYHDHEFTTEISGKGNSVNLWKTTEISGKICGRFFEICGKICEICGKICGNYHRFFKESTKNLQRIYKEFYKNLQKIYKES